ncbi:hypothetical protein GJAV_G00188660 [Gymnothorax javanicus]|nr:hypothetical protein GJAV_G00188660 [Gymnothorax javanicus]
MGREAGEQLEQHAVLQHDHRLTSRALLTWRSAWYKVRHNQFHHRRVILQWKGVVKRRRWHWLCCIADQLQANRTLYGSLRGGGNGCASPRSWLKEVDPGEVISLPGVQQVRECRHLLAVRRARAAFTLWHCGCGLRRAVRALADRVQKSQLLQCLRGWRTVVDQRSA